MRSNDMVEITDALLAGKTAENWEYGSEFIKLSKEEQNRIIQYYLDDFAKKLRPQSYEVDVDTLPSLVALCSKVKRNGENRKIFKERIADHYIKEYDHIINMINNYSDDFNIDLDYLEHLLEIHMSCFSIYPEHFNKVPDGFIEPLLKDMWSHKGDRSPTIMSPRIFPLLDEETQKTVKLFMINTKNNIAEYIAHMNRVNKTRYSLADFYGNLPEEHQVGVII